MMMFRMERTIVRGSEIAGKLSGRDASVVDISDAGEYFNQYGREQLEVAYGLIGSALIDEVGPNGFFRQGVLRVYSYQGNDVEETEEVFVVPHEGEGLDIDGVLERVAQNIGKTCPDKPFDVSVYPLQAFLSECVDG